MYFAMHSQTRLMSDSGCLAGELRSFRQRLVRQRLVRQRLRLIRQRPKSPCQRPTGQFANVRYLVLTEKKLLIDVCSGEN